MSGTVGNLYVSCSPGEKWDTEVRILRTKGENKEKNKTSVIRGGWVEITLSSDSPWVYIVSSHWPGGTEEIHETTQSEYL
jgi:hypothetical protein